MSESQFTTVFHFICSHCRQVNEYRQTHAPSVRPHLVSTKCSKCRTLNWLGGIKGTLVTPDVVPQSLDDTVITIPEGGPDLPLKQPPD